MNDSNICDKCGMEVEIGTWPFCPHDVPSRGATAAFGIHHDTVNFEIDRVFTNAGDVNKAMREAGLEMRGAGKGKPGQWI